MRAQAPDQRAGLADSLFDIRRVLQTFYKVLTGHVGFGAPNTGATGIGTQDNIDGVLVKYVTGGVADTITHNLGRVPVGFFVANISAAVVLTNFSTVTTTTCKITSSVAAVTATIFIF